MKFLFGFIFFVIAVMVSFSLGSRDWQFAFIGLATLLGVLFGQVISLSKQLNALRQSLLKQDEFNKQALQVEDISEPTKDTDVSKSVLEEINNDAQVSSNHALENSISENSQSQEYIDVIQQASAEIEPDQSLNDSSKESILNNQVVTSENATLEDDLKSVKSNKSIFDKLLEGVKSYFTGGNIFVRIGIIILFFGVSFLLKYVSERGLFPVEYRLIAVVVGAMFLLGLGWRLRHKNETYALLLQGAGIGMLYLDIFAAYNLYQLLPPLATFVLLFVVSMFSAALAVLQDAKSLAILGFSGGFLAPILASSGANNHIGLFSYYAILNVAIVLIAWFKAWRELNLLGFAFTFIIGTVWGVFSYNSTKFATTEPFLVLFFVFYVLIAVFYALRQPSKPVLGVGGGYVDGTLLFGVPLAASSLQYYLVKDMPYGVSISSFVLGAFYCVLAGFIWKRKGVGLKLLAEAFLALGVIFASMAIPFALAPTQTAAAWALEGAGFIWLGSRQNRLSVRAFGVLLQLAAGGIYLWKFTFTPNETAFINSEFISAIMVAVAGILSARFLIKPFEGQKQWERWVSPVLLAWGLIWLIAGIFSQIEQFYPNHLKSSLMSITITVISLGLIFIAIREKPIWKHALAASFTLFILMIPIELSKVIWSAFQSGVNYHPSLSYGWITWPAAFLVYYLGLYHAQKHILFSRFQSFCHNILLLLAVLLITVEGYWWIEQTLAVRSSWLAIGLAIPSVLVMWIIIKAKVWPFTSHSDSYKRYSGSILAMFLSLWSFVAIFDKGESDPLPWLPLLNPLDITLMIIFITLFNWWQSMKQVFVDKKQTDNPTSSRIFSVNKKIFNRKLFVMGFAALAFLWINFTLFRVAHHWFNIPYTEYAMYHSNLVQTAVSILWAFTGVVLTLFASRKNKRLLWLIGAVLLGMVVLKLFVIDLSALGSLGRVISFLVVGILLTSIGYFAPLPDKNEELTKKVENTDNQSDKQDATNNGTLSESGDSNDNELV